MFVWIQAFVYSHSNRKSWDFFFFPFLIVPILLHYSAFYLCVCVFLLLSFLCLFFPFSL